MRALNRNKQKIYHANYVGESPILDENGLNTGDKEITYTEPEEAWVNISASRGTTSVEMFGTDISYTNTIVTDEDLGIDEHSVLWIDREPTEPYNYIVVLVAKSINSFSYAIRKVDVS